MVHTMGLAEREGVDLRGGLTWAFLFDGREYFEGFRTLSTNGIGKPVLNAFVMLGMLQGRRIPLTGGDALGIERIIEKAVRAQPDIDGRAAQKMGSRPWCWASDPRVGFLSEGSLAELSIHEGPFAQAPSAPGRFVATPFVKAIHVLRLNADPSPSIRANG